jgi:hypothetical protein
MTTLTDYKAAVSAKGFEAVTESSAITAAINAARRRVATDPHRWTFQEAADGALTTAYGDSTVDVPETWRIDAVRLVDTCELEYRAPQEVRRLVALDDTPGTPQYWTKRAGELIFFPVPDGTYAVTVDYTDDTVTPLVDDADVEADLPDLLIDTVAWAAFKDIAFRLRDYNAMNFAEGEYQSHLSAAIRKDNVQQRQTSRQVVSNPRRWDGY